MVSSFCRVKRTHVRVDHEGIASRTRANAYDPVARILGPTVAPAG